MSCNYADGLSKYENKGICGVPEVHDSPAELDRKVQMLADMIKEAKHVVFHTGAGISTSAGIPDFRGPKGIWTLENKGIKPEISISFTDAVPTATHMALLALAGQGMLHFLVSQNVDGLHLKSSFPLEKFAELHGNMFLDKCNYCERLFIRNEASESVGQKCNGQVCPLPKQNGRRCRGKLHDTILDWEDELPNRDIELAESHSKKADLSVCLGSTLQIVPSGKLPLLTKKSGGKLVICNLQPTKLDKQADLIIRGYVDEVMKKLLTLLDIEIPEYKLGQDPTKYVDSTFKEYVIEASNNGHTDNIETKGYYENTKRLKKDHHSDPKVEKNIDEKKVPDNTDKKIPDNSDEKVSDRSDEKISDKTKENCFNDDEKQDSLNEKKKQDIFTDIKEPNILDSKKESNVLDSKKEPNILDSIKEPNVLDSKKEPNVLDSKKEQNSFGIEKVQTAIGKTDQSCHDGDEERNSNVKKEQTSSCDEEVQKGLVEKI